MGRRVIILLLLIPLVGFLGYLAGSSKPEWQCPVYSINSENISVIPIVNDQYSNITFNEITQAKSSILVIMYEMKMYDSKNSVMKLENAFIDAVKRNVSVQLILDQAIYRDQITELSKINKQTAEYLQKGGVQVKYDSMKQTTHDKLLIFDNKSVVVGSHNWGYSAFENNNEASVLIKNSNVAEYYTNYFEFLWKTL